MPARRTSPFAAALLLGIAFAQPAAAAPVEVTFLPPAIPPQPICVSNRNDPGLLERWSSWDPATLPSGDPKDVIRDAKLLAERNPSANFQLADGMLVAASRMKAAKVPDVVVDRINLHLKAAKIPQLRETGLVEKLEAESDSLNSRALNTLGELYLNGMVVQKDREKALDYLTRAATAGNADALLRLAGMTVGGQEVPGWQLDPKLAVTMAFGALVGKLDPEICGRLERIAREYSKGEVVAMDHVVAEQWFRLAADLGDPAAAWRVAQLHLESELIVKDNDALLKYLQMAADGGVGAAKVELGEFYEAGALLPGDKAKAEALYAEAAELGTRLGLLRLTTLLEKETTPEGIERYRAALNQLTGMPQPPGWAYSKLAKLILTEKGRWAGEAEAKALLEKGVALEDADSAQLLASILLRHRDEPGVFEQATELLGLAVSGVGKIDPMTDLGQAYLCRAPKGSDLRLATFWQGVEEAAGNSSEMLAPDVIRALQPDTDPLLLAQLQTHALYGRPNSVAYYIDYLRHSGASSEVLDFWRSRAEVPSVLQAGARYNIQASPTPETLAEGLAALKKAREAGVQRASLDLGSVLLDYFPNDEAKREEAMGHLQEAAQHGIGEAILRMLPIMQEQGIGPEDLLSRYDQAIDERGDADALIFAASTTLDLAKRRDYLYRAASVLDCTFQNTLRLASAFVGTEDSAETERWLQVSQRLAGDDGWRHVAIGDRYMAMGGPEQARTALALYEEGARLGDGSALGRLVKIYADPANRDYAPAKAVAMFKRLIDQAPVTDLADLHEKVQKAPPAIRTAVMHDVDWSARYATAAAGGDIVAMRELALYLRSTGKDAATAREASTWLKRAAEGGDAVAMVELAKAYAMGIGIAPSIQQATVLLKDAAGLGNEEARDLLATMTMEN